MIRRPPRSPLFPSPTLFRSAMQAAARHLLGEHDFSSFRASGCQAKSPVKTLHRLSITRRMAGDGARSEEHTSELQSRPHLVCRLLLEKKKKTNTASIHVLPV